MDPILFPTPGNPLPDPSGERHIAGYFTTRDGKRLRYALFKADIRVAKGTVVLLHGRNESIEKYFETIADLNRLGLWVATFDWRGQAGSQRDHRSTTAGYVRRFADYQHDLEDFLELVVLPDTRLPFFILAHSAGALVALAAAPALANRIDRMVLSAPFVALGGQALSQRSVGIMAKLMSWIGLGRRTLTRNRTRPDQAFAGNPLTHDRERFRRNEDICRAAPFLVASRPTARWVGQALSAIEKVRKPEHLASIRIPTLILAAGSDSIVPLQAIEELASYFRAGKVITIDRARHEIFQESDLYREQALAAIAAFLPGSEEEAREAG